MHLYLPSIIALVLLTPSGAGKSSCKCAFPNEMFGHIYNISLETKTTQLSLIEKPLSMYDFDLDTKWKRCRIYDLDGGPEYIQDYENETMYKLQFDKKGTVTNCKYIDLHDSLKLLTCLPGGVIKIKNDPFDYYDPYYKPGSKSWYNTGKGGCDPIEYFENRPYNGSTNATIWLYVEDYLTYEERSHYFPNIPVECDKVAIESFSK